MSSESETAVRAMTWRAIQEVEGLTSANDFELISLLMRCALSHGFTFDMLEAFRGAKRLSCFGFFRDRTHYVGICMVQTGFDSRRGGILAQTEGDFGGVWVFILDTDSSVLTSRDGEAVSSFEGPGGAGLDGPDLIQAVIASALTAEITPVEPTGRWRPWRRS